MNSSRKRHSGGAYRLMETMISAHAKAGKDRTKARKHQQKPKRKDSSQPWRKYTAPAEPKTQQP